MEDQGLTLSEAARILSESERHEVTAEAVRQRVRRHQIEGRKVGREWRVYLPQPMDLDSTALAVRGAEAGAIQPGELVAILRDQLMSYQQTIREQERLIGQLRAELTRANADLRAMERTLRRAITLLPPETGA